MIVGAVVGAGIGWLTRSEAGKKALDRIGRSDVIKVYGTELARITQEMMTEQAVNGLSQMTNRLLHHDDESDRKAIIGEDENVDRYEVLQEENREIIEKLQLLEQKIDEMHT